MPVIVYNVPDRTGRTLSADALGRCSATGSEAKSQHAVSSSTPTDIPDELVSLLTHWVTASDRCIAVAETLALEDPQLLRPQPER